jgi:hypothetical protein
MSKLTPKSDAADAANAAAMAKQRFFAMSILRLGGAFVVMLGLLISTGYFDRIQGDRAKWAGLAVSVIGLLQFSIIPRVLARAWSSTKAQSDAEQSKS